MQVRVCEGCGATLQSADPSLPGYVPEKAIQGANRTLCRRCHRNRSYGREVTSNYKEEERSGGLRYTVEQADLSILVTDICDFEGTFSKRLASNCGRRLLVVVNKVDLLPGKTPHAEVLAWVQRRLAEAHVSCKAVFLVSATKGTGIKALWDAVKKELGGRGTVALIGVSGVGKTALLTSWQELGTRQEGKKKRTRRAAKRKTPEEKAVAAAAVVEPEKVAVELPDPGEPALAPFVQPGLPLGEVELEQNSAPNGASTSDTAPMPIRVDADKEAAEDVGELQAVSPPKHRKRPPRRKKSSPANKAPVTPPTGAGEATKPLAAERAVIEPASPTSHVRRNRRRPRRHKATMVPATPTKAVPESASEPTKIDRSEIRVLESPSIPGRGRISGLLCSDCVQKLQLQKPLRSKALRLKAGQGVILGGLTAVAVIQVTPPEKTAFLLLFVPPATTVQRVPADALTPFSQGEQEPWQYDVCAVCAKRLHEGGWEEAEVDLHPAEDLALHGLGWLSARKNTATLRVLVPTGMFTSIRPRLVGPKEEAAE